MILLKKPVRYAFLKTNSTNLNYIDKILQDWHKKGVKTLEDINPQNKKTYSTNKAIPFRAAKKDEYSHDVSKIRKQLLGLGDN